MSPAPEFCGDLEPHAAHRHTRGIEVLACEGRSLPMSPASPAAVEAFESRIRDAGFYIETRSFLETDDGEPTDWYYFVSKRRGEKFPVPAVLSFRYEDDDQFGVRAAKEVISTLERRP